MKCINKKLYDQPIYTLLPISDASHLTSCPPTEKPHSHPNIKENSVLNPLNCLPNRHPPHASPHYIRQISDWFLDGWIE